MTMEASLSKRYILSKISTLYFELEKNKLNLKVITLLRVRSRRLLRKTSKLH